MPISGSTSAQTRRVVIRSVGTAAAGVVSALRQALPFSEERLAACIYRAPAELLGHLDQTTAEALAQALMTMGLEAETLGPSETFTPGGPDYDVALAIQGTDRLLEATREIATFLGVPFMQARQILCACPTELIGKVSANTVAAIRRRLERLGIAVDVSRREGAVFDLFVGECPPPQQAEVQRCLREAGVPTGDSGEAGDAPRPRVLAGLREPEAKACYERLKGCDAPIRIVNRDFQRFDVRLEEARDTPAMVEFLMESTGMPEAVAKKVPARTPIVIHHNLPYRETQEALARIAGLGGRASAHLLALKNVRLQLAKVGDPDSTARLLEVLGGIEPERAREMVRVRGVLDHRATVPQARWLQHELRRVGTDARMVVA